MSDPSPPVDILYRIAELLGIEVLKEIIKEFIRKFFKRSHIKENIGNNLLKTIAEGGVNKLNELNLELIKEDEETKKQVDIQIRTIH